MSRAQYKFQKAISELSRSGSLHERLINAYLVNLVHLQIEELPDEVRTPFLAFKDGISRLERENYGSPVTSGADSVLDADVTNMVNALFEMYDAIRRGNTVTCSVEL